jgi:opacity protein-like surface antigen
MKIKLVLVLMVAWMAVIVPAYAQDVQQDEPIPVQIEDKTKATENRNSRAVRSFYNTIARNERNRFGFNLGASEGYITNVFPDSQESQPSMLTAFSSGIFANFGRHRSKLHMDYGGGYRIYNQQRSMDGFDAYGNTKYTYQANRKLRFELSDLFSSSLNDPFSSFGLTLDDSIDWTPSPSYAVTFITQRLTRNLARGQMDVDFTRKTHFTIFGTYENYWYEDQDFRNVGGMQVGAGIDQKITSWLILSSTYSTYLNDVDERLGNYLIHRVEIGRFRFMLSRDVELYMSGGIEVANTRGQYQTDGMFRIGISRVSKKNAIYANYQRTMMTAIGFDRVLPSDMVTLGLGQRISEKTSFRLSGSYMHGADYDYSGTLQGYYARAQFEYALHTNLFVSANYTYQRQSNSIGGVSDIPDYNRSVVFVSLQYAWPSIRPLSE